MKNYINWPIARQITVASTLLVVAAFLVVTFVISASNRTRALAEANEQLEKEVGLMAATLDAYFENVKVRGERESKLFKELLGGEITLHAQKTMTGETELPTLKIGNNVINGNHALLERFQQLIGSDAAFLVADAGKLYRASTLLKRDGKTFDGVPLPAEDPVSRAILAGNDYAGMTVRNGQYFFSVVKALKDGSGKTFGAYSVRIAIDKELQQIRNNFASMTAGKTGYVYVLRPTGDDQIAEFVVHPKHVGQSLRKAYQDEETINALKSVIEKGKGIFEYQLRNDAGKLEDKVVAIARSENWKWTVAFGTWSDEYMDGVRASRNSILLIGALASVLTALALGLIIRARMAELGPAVEAIRRLGAGDLTISYQGNGTKNEVGQLGDAIASTLRHMRDLVAEVTAASDALSSSAAQVESRAQQLASGATQQSSSASAMAAAVEELSVSISHVADNAHESANISTTACAASAEGMAVVNNAVAEMQSIASRIADSAQAVEALVAQSESISNVVKVIRDIADQTNLLALNAAIEAARAGEHGRGFAVVADEVRKLAERTSTSTHEISTTISAIVGSTHQAVEQMNAVRERVDESLRLSGEAGQSLQVIDERNQKTLSIAQDIASGTREQSSTSQDLARTVEQIAQSSELTAVSASENQRAAHQLKELADGLERSLRTFRI